MFKNIEFTYQLFPAHSIPNAFVLKVNVNIVLFFSSRKSGSSEDRRKSLHQPPPDAVLDDTSMIRMVEFDPAHREMAVDVPETFVARTKTPPRWEGALLIKKGGGCM